MSRDDVTFMRPSNVRAHCAPMFVVRRNITQIARVNSQPTWSRRVMPDSGKGLHKDRVPIGLFVLLNGP